MTEQPEQYTGLVAVGRAGPLFGERTGRLRVEPRRAVVETPVMRGLRAAIVELGGLPEDDESDYAPIPESFGRLHRLRRERAIADARLPTSAGATEGSPDVGVVEPPEWTGGRARVPGSTRGPRQELARWCRMGGLPLPQLGYVWRRESGWSFDAAWPHPRLAVVFDGGRGISAVPGAGWIRDSLRLNEAVIEGWSVLRLTPVQVGDGSAYALVARALTSPWRRV